MKTPDVWCLVSKFFKKKTSWNPMTSLRKTWLPLAIEAHRQLKAAMPRHWWLIGGLPRLCQWEKREKMGKTSKNFSGCCVYLCFLVHFHPFSQFVFLRRSNLPVKQKQRALAPCRGYQGLVMWLSFGPFVSEVLWTAGVFGISRCWPSSSHIHWPLGSLWGQHLRLTNVFGGSDLQWFWSGFESGSRG